MNLDMLLLDKLERYNIVLFSGSPRRREIMRGAGIKFTVFTEFEVKEEYPSELCGYEVAEFLSLLKATNYPINLNYNDVIITADTIVVVDDNIFGKPIDQNDATRMLKMLSGRTHEVITAFSIRTYDQISTFNVCTSVTFKTLTREEINHYIITYEPLDKAGAYGIQEWIGFIGVEKIDGSYFNVMGLPICKLCQRLDEILKY